MTNSTSIHVLQRLPGSVHVVDAELVGVAGPAGRRPQGQAAPGTAKPSAVTALGYERSNW